MEGNIWKVEFICNSQATIFQDRPYNDNDFYNNSRRSQGQKMGRVSSLARDILHTLTWYMCIRT